jgi:tripeptide aminopeptidase
MINKKRFINNFFRLVTIDSPTGSEEEISNFLINFLKDNQLIDHAQKDSFGNIYARKFGVGENPIFFTDHLDTVEPGRGIQPCIQGEYVVSSGDTILGADDKSSVAAIIEMLFVLRERDLAHQPLEFIFTISEEVGNLGAVNFDYSLLAAKKGYCFDCSWPLGTVVVASPFYERFDGQLIGRSAHASRPELGINVLPAFAQLLEKTKLGKIDYETVFNIGHIEGGSVRNAVPGEVQFNGEIRSFNEANLENYKSQFLSELGAISHRNKLQYEIEFIRENPGFKLQEDVQLLIIQELTPIFNAVDLEINPTETWSVSDTNIFMEKGLTCINLGSGREFAHTTRERIKIETLEKLANIMIEIIKL